ncbi:hypothetical protein MNBD_GAMMA02-1630 [hydrothermal vent metagenome]|uniref:Uncharacterized protein n=1 Tax=hydrothermal vent metagenome TaxID=652676 RepID=A0A3B0VY26_9ZZZZ
MKKVIVLVLMLVAALAWLYFERSTDSKKTSINQITFQQTNQNNLAKTPKQNADEHRLAVEALIKSQNITPKNPLMPGGERNFMAIYRDINLAKDCSPFYRNHHQTLGKYNHLEAFNISLQYKSSQQAPPNQVQALEDFVQQCLTLKSAVFFRASIDTEFPEYKFAHPVLVELRKEWHNSQPETPAEKHLDKVTKLSKQWQQSLEELLQISSGDFFYSKEERDSLEKSALQIQQQIDVIYQQTDQADWNEINKLQQQIKALSEQKNQRLPVDEEQRLSALDAFNQLTYYMEQAMYDGFPASFVTLIENLEMADHFQLKVASADYYPYSNDVIKLIPEYTPPSQHLFAYAKTQDQQVFNLLIEPASQLMLCYMGADCSAESAWVRQYCLGNKHRVSTFPDACGKSLLDFYTDDYLTPNLWLDVSELFDKMVSYYES